MAEQEVQKLVSALRDAIDSMAPRVEEWKKWKALYKGKTKKKDFPWPDASNLHVPLISTTTEAVYSRLVGAIFFQRPLVTVLANSRAAEEYSKPLEEFLDVMLTSSLELNALTNLSPWLMNLCEYGTGIIKTVWVEEVRGSAHLYTGPRMYNIPLKDFIAPPRTSDIQNCDWVAHRIRLTERQLQERAERGLYDKEAVSKLTSVEEAEEEERREVYEVYEVWAKDTMGVDRVYLMDLEGNLMRPVAASPYEHGFRPFTVGVYIPSEESFYGMGIPEMLEHIQAEVNTIHNQRRDNATLANTKSFLVRLGSGLKPGLKLWPGKVTYVTDLNDLRPLEMGTIGLATTISEENIAQGYGERRSGVSDYNLGMEAITRPTATGTMALLQESSKRLDIITLFCRDALTEAIRQCVQLYRQFYPEGKLYYVMGERGALVEKVFRLPFRTSELRSLFEFRITTTRAGLNRDIHKQNLIVAADRLATFYQKMIEIATLVSNPQVPEAVRQLGSAVAKSATVLMEQVLEAFEFKDPNSLLPSMLEDLYGFVRTQSPVQQPNIPGVPPPSAGPPGGLPEQGDVLAGLGVSPLLQRPGRGFGVGG